MTGVTVRAITDVRELRAVEDLQREVWGMPDRDVVPYHQLLAATTTGGAVLGAFTSDERLVGFCYGFVGLRAGRLLFYSHMAGVLPDYRNHDVGYTLKRAQRDAALSRGLDEMVWTYDPLMSPNAHFNLHKLGATARRYYVDYYGEMPDALNRGLPSDRLEVDWQLRDPRVVALMAGSGEGMVEASSLPPTGAKRHDGGHEPLSPEPLPAALAAYSRAGAVAPGDPALDLRAVAVRVEIPTGFAELRVHYPDLALDWRLATRHTLREYFRRGYRAVDFIAGAGPAIGFYVLAHAPDRPAVEGTP